MVTSFLVFVYKVVSVIAVRLRLVIVIFVIIDEPVSIQVNLLCVQSSITRFLRMLVSSKIRTVIVVLILCRVIHLIWRSTIEVISCVSTLSPLMIRIHTAVIVIVLIINMTLKILNLTFLQKIKVVTDTLLIAIRYTPEPVKLTHIMALEAFTVMLELLVNLVIACQQVRVDLFIQVTYVSHHVLYKPFDESS